MWDREGRREEGETKEAERKKGKRLEQRTQRNLYFLGPGAQ